MWSTLCISGTRDVLVMASAAGGFISMHLVLVQKNFQVPTESPRNIRDVLAPSPQPMPSQRKVPLTPPLECT